MPENSLRWKFPASSEAREREAMLARIDAWWRDFAKQAPRIDAQIHGREQWDLPGWMNEHFQPLHPELAWEFGPALKADGHRLVITHDGRHDLRPFVQVVLSRAPALPGWEFHAWRPPEDVESALRWVRARTGADLSAYEARAELAPGGTVDITFAPREAGWNILPFRKQKAADALWEAAHVAVECLVGGAALDAHVGGIAVETRGKGAALSELAASVRAHAEAWERQLPDRPYHQLLEEPGLKAGLLELKPDERPDYAERGDLFVAVSRHLPLHQGLMSGRLVDSRRFSRHGETFCYLKLDGSSGFGEDGFADRGELEDAIDAVLVPAGLGCVVGGGTGRRYSYVDLALTDVLRAHAAMRPVLQQGKVPERSWLHFFDAALGTEWLPVWEGAPTPPMPERS